MRVRDLLDMTLIIIKKKKSCFIHLGVCTFFVRQGFHPRIPGGKGVGASWEILEPIETSIIYAADEQYFNLRKTIMISQVYTVLTHILFARWFRK